MSEPRDPLLEVELRYGGGRCSRCGCPLLEGEGPHCGGRNTDGLNCSLTIACLALAQAGGPRTYRSLRAAGETPHGLWAV